jgi:RNA polymerase sigma-70 factor (ECF subfamily)
VSVVGRRISHSSQGSISHHVADEREPLEQLVRAHSAYVARLAYRVLGGEDEVNDLVQDVFLAFLRFRSSIRDASAVRGWLGTTTVRLSLRRLRTRRRRFRFFTLSHDGEPVDAPASGTSPEEHVIFRSIQAALSEVPPDARVAWVLRHLEQEPLADVARLCGCSLATAKRRIALAHNSVKRALSDD